MMPMSSGIKIESWWQKIIPTRPKKSLPTGRNIQNWRNLSPDEPPLPFLAQNPVVVAQSPIKFSEEDGSTSEIAPISKDMEFSPSASLYISHHIHSSSRGLYTIPELSEMNTTITTNSSIIPAIISSHDDSSVSPSSSTSLEQQQQQINNDKSTTPAVIDNIQQVPTSPILAQSIPRLLHNESDCKTLFRDMTESAYRNYNLNKKDQPKEMHILFDAKDNIGAIRFVSCDGMKKDQIGFTGTSQYIPPELANCATYNHELSDVWALGISLYHMLVGHYPFKDTKSHLETFEKMHKSDFNIPKSLSAEVTDLLIHMLNPSSTNRASFEFIRSHPWLNPIKNTKKKKVIKTIKKVIRIVFRGPYPPPSYYSKKP